ncbi:MAG: hypothetical protein LBR81_07825 [Prevotellaceae bacterium]|jgi:TonB family protein|nr:hypothetical protein [Prevotellaceae bacterium]
MNKSKIYGVLGSLGINGLVLLLLFFVTFSGSKAMLAPDKEEIGLEVMFGDGAGGAGAANPGGSISEPVLADATVPPPASEIQSNNGSSAEDPVMSQIDDSEIEIPDHKPVVKKQETPKKETPPQNLSVEEKLKNLEKLRQQEALRQQRLEEQRQAQLAAENAAKANRAASAIASAFGAGSGGGVGNGVGAGSGSGGGTGTGGDGFGSGNGSGGTGSSPGNPLGRGAGGGNSWSLAGRGIRGTLIKPQYVGSQEGKIIVQITVDKTGKVIATSIAQGTTITDENQRAECRAKARAQQFTPDPKATGNVIGTITYNFKMD